MEAQPIHNIISALLELTAQAGDNEGSNTILSMD